MKEYKVIIEITVKANDEVFALGCALDQIARPEHYGYKTTFTHHVETIPKIDDENNS